MMTSKGLLRLGAVCGVAHIVLWIVAEGMLGQMPTASDSPDTVVRFYVDHADDLQVTGFLIGLAMLCFLGFAVALHRVLRATEGEDGYVANLSLASGGVWAAMILVGFGLGIVPAYRPENIQDPALVRMYLDSAEIIVDGFAFFTLALFVAATSIAIVRAGVLPRWSGWAGMAVSALLVIGAGSLLTTSGALAADGGYGELAFLLFGAWSIAVAALLALRAGVSISVRQPAAA